MDYGSIPSAKSSQPSMHSTTSVNDIEESDEEAICVQEIEHKGKGLVAARPIKRGELLLAERPFLVLPSDPSNSSILVALSQCSREEQRTFFSLSNSFRDRLLPAIGIFESNAIYLPHSDPAREQEAIFLLASRFNSSCSPNVSKCWDPTLHAMLFRTLRDVEEGEELCFNYCDVLGTRDQRREEILEERNFECRCEVCELDDEESRASDERRSTIARLFEEVAGCGKEPTLGMRKIKIALRLLKEEKLIHYETSFYYDAFQFCVMVSDFSNAKAWIKRSWEISCCTSGPDSDIARMFKLYWANPRAHEVFLELQCPILVSLLQAAAYILPRRLAQPDSSLTNALLHDHAGLYEAIDAKQGRMYAPPILLRLARYTKFKVKPIHLKGAAVSAARDLTKGEIILSESPIFTLPLVRDQNAVMGGLHACNSEYKRMYYDMCNCHDVSDEMSKELGIFATNGIPCGTDCCSGRVADREGVFVISARINHSCTPNVNGSWIDWVQQIEQRATRDIKKGEELCRAYIDVLLPKEERQKVLMDKYWFKCKCESCILTGDKSAASDQRRRRIREILDKHFDGKAKDVDEGFLEVREGLKLVAQEGLVAYDSAFYFFGFHLCAASSDFESAKEWAVKARDTHRLVFGQTLEEIYERLVANPACYPDARTLPQRSLHGPDSPSWNSHGIGTGS
ncbi:hypothetical protein EIP91_000764 [Steccherinum ochraceum]|uniref:SET domain-containing protein n=1 Tax=Steccherinum ochraceum TaxID=92696 RepID=A0A4R0RLQ4_9APHY|nr:hypothetical protein EIP91_000764 [Steccherinum ochraceum]